MTLPLWLVPLVVFLILGLYVYVHTNDAKLLAFPARALVYSPKRCLPVEALEIAKQLKEEPISIDDQIPPRTGRRYIVIGGAGFLGGWIVVALLRRGEDPRNIRVLDIHAPVRKDLLQGKAQEVGFRKVDMADRGQVFEAFQAPWPLRAGGEHGNSGSTTVFHVASNIRYFERHPSLMPLSTRVNVDGAHHIVEACKAVGVETLVYTSSASISIWSAHYLMWPWEKEPRKFVQVIGDDDDQIPKLHSDFFSNYAASKWKAERVIREADRSVLGDTKMLRTGAIRPGNGVFGGGGDMLYGATMIRKINPAWGIPLLQSCVYVENCALAHLLYERQLIALSHDENLPDIGGQAFVVSDPGPVPTNEDIYTILETVSGGVAKFPRASPTGLLLIAHIIEAYYLTRHFLLSSPRWCFLGKILPQLSPLVTSLQPSVFNLTSCHLVMDDSRARLPPERGGLGYKGGWTTLQGLCETVDAFKRGDIPTTHKREAAEIKFPGFGFLGERLKSLLKDVGS